MAAQQSQEEQNRNSAFRSLDTLFGRIKDGTIAGAILRDEATSTLDVTTERQVLRNIVQQKPNPEAS